MEAPQTKSDIANRHQNKDRWLEKIQNCYFPKRENDICCSHTEFVVLIPILATTRVLRRCYGVRRGKITATGVVYRCGTGSEFAKSKQNCTNTG